MNDMPSTVFYPPQEDSSASLCDEQDIPPIGEEIARQYLHEWQRCFQQDSSSTVTPDDVHIDSLCARIDSGDVDIMTFYYEFDVFLHSDE